MNNYAKVAAFRSFYAQAKELYLAGDKSSSKELFFKAASLANEISMESKSLDVRMEYHNQAEKILLFLKQDFNKVPKKVNSSSSEDETPKFSALEKKEKITFKDVAGLDDVKDEIIYNVIEPFSNPELAKKYNIKPGAKILLYGPPGTGKTFIARAIAGEVDAAFYAINCQDLISKYVGESSKQIDALFNEAESNKKAIIFFDEFDAIAARRESNGEADSEMARFVASFLTKVDGFKKSENCEMLLLIAATNRPWAIDQAMLRGGRFDTHIYVGLPDEKARRFLIERQFKGVKLADDLSISYLVDKLKNFGGADIVSACQKMNQLAYRKALKNKKEVPVTLEDANKVIDNLHVTVSKEELEAFNNFKKGN